MSIKRKKISFIWSLFYAMLTKKEADMKEIISYIMIRDLDKLSEKHAKIFTRINLAFSTLENGRAIIKEEGKMAELKRIRACNEKLKVVLSIGGAGAFGFSDMAMTRETRLSFLQSMTELVKKYSLDGIDLDWEFPCTDWGGDFSPKDKQNFTLLIKEMRESLDALGDKKYILSIAAGVGQWFIDTTELSIYHKYLDDIMLMTYDLRGFGQEITGHHTALYTKKNDVMRMSANDGIRLIENEGVPREKIVIGAGFYSRNWLGVADTENGLLQRALPKGGNIHFEYPILQSEVVENPDFTVHWDDEARVSWAYSKKLGIFESFDDARSVGEKCAFVLEKGLKGLMFWRYCDWEENPLIDKMAEMLK